MSTRLLDPPQPSLETPLTVGDLLKGVADGIPPATARLQVPGVYDDSRSVQPGGLFVAIAGNADDGRKYAEEAVRRGAVVVLGHALPPLTGAAAIATEDPRAALATIAARWRRLDQPPANELALFGVTGTNGKSTTTYMLRAILAAAGTPCGLLGTIEYDLCGRTLPSKLTTPGALDLSAFVQECAQRGAKALVMEASSHALAQKRTDGVKFTVGVFTNLTGDHMDYHASIEDYAAAKARLFERLAPDSFAVINADDPHGPRMLAACPARPIRFSLEREADVCGKIGKESVRGTSFKLRIGPRTLPVESRLIGRHNVYNALGAAGAAHALGIPIEKIVEGLTALKGVPGRLERVACDLPGEVFVDYAHTDDALQNVLRVLRPLTGRRLMLVFGCGGDRDRSKRPRMAAVAAEYADAIVATSDNPRTEEPRRILDDILAGFPPAVRKRVMVEPDRRAAIRGAISTLNAGDVLLLAGKGHENYQIIGTQRLPFDDVQEALQAAIARKETTHMSDT